MLPPALYLFKFAIRSSQFEITPPCPLPAFIKSAIYNLQSTIPQSAISPSRRIKIDLELGQMSIFHPRPVYLLLFLRRVTVSPRPRFVLFCSMLYALSPILGRILHSDSGQGTWSMVLLNHSISQHLARNTAALSWRSHETSGLGKQLCFLQAADYHRSNKGEIHGIEQI